MDIIQTEEEYAEMIAKINLAVKNAKTMSKKLTLPKDKSSIAIRAEYFEEDNLLSKGDFVQSFDPKLNQPIIWVKVAAELLKKVLAAHGIDSSNQIVVYSPKTEERGEILVHNGSAEFEIK